LKAIIIIGLTRLLSIGLKKLHQPRVIAEVLGGIILGPSAFGLIPGFTATIFPPGPSRDQLKLVADIGLILYLFLVGLELDPQVMKHNVKKSLLISLAGMALPFVLGAAASFYLYEHLTVSAEKPPFSSFFLFTGVAMSITAFPVLARILTEKSLLSTNVGLMTISAAAVDDAMAWSLLALVIAILNSSNSLVALYVFLLVVTYAALLFFGVRPLYLRLIDYVMIRDSATLNHFLLAFTFLCIFLSSWITELIGVHAIFGSFLFGLIIPQENGFAIMITEKMEDMVLIVFLPLYFAFSGLKTELGTISDATSWAMLFLVIAVACVGKVVGCTLTARLVGIPWREATTIGVLMNTKGLVELIVLNIGLDAEVIDKRIFAIMVLMALTTTFITSPVVDFLYPPKYRKSYQDDHEKSASVVSQAQGDHSCFKLFLSLFSIEDVSTISAILPMLQSENESNVELHCSRLRENSELSSNVMIATRTTTSTAFKLDPVLRMMSIFGELLKIPVIPHLSVTSYEGYVQELSMITEEEQLNMVLIPYRRHKSGVYITSGLDLVVSEVIKVSKAAVGICVDLGASSKVFQSNQRYRILVPFIGGASHHAAVHFASQLAAGSRVEVTVLILEDNTSSNSDLTKLKKFMKLIAQKGTRCELKEYEGSLRGKEAIIDECRTIKYDVLIMGYHNTVSASHVSRQSVNKLPSIFGSTTEYLMENIGQILMIAVNAENAQSPVSHSASFSSTETVL
jgi:Kef-type K+ transport system membrane component KefB/nucleotide-binding universal stress UspA family protein